MHPTTLTTPNATTPHRWTLMLTQAGSDENVFVALMDEVTPHLRRRLRGCPTTEGLFRCPDDVDDVLQDLRAAAWKAVRSFRPEAGSATGWLWVIARNCAVNRLRDRTKRRRLSLTGPAAPEVPVAAPGPADGLADSEQLERWRLALAEALAGSRPEEREAWRLRVEEDRPYEEVAAALDVPKGTVATWLSRLKARARARLT